MNHIPRKVPPARSAFTLIELLVVIAIIGILASMILATAGYVQEKAARSRAEAEIAALSAALESYKVDNGDYPLGTNALAVRRALLPLVGDTKPGGGTISASELSNFKVYMELNAGQMNNLTSQKAPTTTSEIIDPFGTRYNYTYPGDVARSGVNFFDLWSTGKRATRGNLTQQQWELQWIKNW